MRDSVGQTIGPHVKSLGWRPKRTISRKNNSSSNVLSSQRECEQAMQIESLKAKPVQSQTMIEEVQPTIHAVTRRRNIKIGMNFLLM